MRIERFLEHISSEAIRDCLQTDAAPLLRPAQDERHGDYQLNGLLALGKQRGIAPRSLAEPVAKRLAEHEAIAAAEVAGPGFVNLKLSAEWLNARLVDALKDLERDGVTPVEAPKTVVVDFSSPNVAKQMHVGHLRSTILGDALVRLLRFSGHKVIGDNHIGDWGTQFGLLIAGVRRFGMTRADGESAIAALERVYRDATALAKDDRSFAELARSELAKLQAGDADNTRVWQEFVATTRAELDRIYDRLGVRFDEWLGESAYQPLLAGVVQDLVDKGIAREDQGALCVFFDGNDGRPKIATPLIVRKQDGAFLYSTTDIAAIFYRRDHFKADRSVYVVDSRQALHFKQVFAVAAMLGIEMELEFLGFGTVLGADGKPLKTRDGTNITLRALLDEAEQRAAQRIREEGLAVDESEIERVAKVVGIGAVKYADLRQNRLSDYQFDWEKLISFKGNAGPYLQYAYARICSMLRKADRSIDSAFDGPIAPHEPAEISLARQLARFPDVVHQAAETGFPHLLCDHLYQVAKLFSTFYEACPVLRSEHAMRESRLALSALAARQLKRGLTLLGIDVVDRM